MSVKISVQRILNEKQCARAVRNSVFESLFVKILLTVDDATNNTDSCNIKILVPAFRFDISDTTHYGKLQLIVICWFFLLWIFVANAVCVLTAQGICL